MGTRTLHAQPAILVFTATWLLENMPSLVAAQYEPNVKAFYEKLLGRGKTKMQANVAVMRKLLHAIHGMLKHDQDFEGQKFYVIGA